jgi:hypothetical protein
LQINAEEKNIAIGVPAGGSKYLREVTMSRIPEGRREF